MYEDRLTTEGESSTDRPMDDEAFGKPEQAGHDLDPLTTTLSDNHCGPRLTPIPIVN